MLRHSIISALYTNTKPSSGNKSTPPISFYFNQSIRKNNDGFPSPKEKYSGKIKLHISGYGLFK